MKFKKGDKVIKARRYSVGRYCFHGGSDYSVPIGTKGTVTSSNSTGTNTRVDFDNGMPWNVHAKELDHEKVNWRKRLEE